MAETEDFYLMPPPTVISFGYDLVVVTLRLFLISIVSEIITLI